MFAFLNGIINCNIIKTLKDENNLSFENGNEYKKTFLKTDRKKSSFSRHQKIFTRIIASSRAPNRRSTWLN